MSISSSSQVSVDFTERLAPRRRAMMMMIHRVVLLCPFKVRRTEKRGRKLWTRRSYLNRVEISKKKTTLEENDSRE